MTALERLDAIQARLDAATRGTWVVGGRLSGPRQPLSVWAALRPSVLVANAWADTECECADKSTPGHVEVNEVGTTCNVLYTTCFACCTGGSGYQTEDCVNHPQPCYPCATVGGITNVREFAERNARAATADGYAATVISRTVTYSEWEEAPNA